MNSVYRINFPDVISEAMELEQVVIDLKSGCYYNMNEFATEIWRRIEFGYNTEEIIQELTNSSQQMKEDSVLLIKEFIKKLEEEQLIVVTEIDANKKTKKIPSSNLKFGLPSYQKFDDMQEMLLLDPIHEVSEAGWPNIKE